ncbi:MAG: FlgD immunoglobulin-like domain containing protein [Chloroherpetonaceae bacterium]|nr:hypothetical protein [bacterium]
MKTITPILLSISFVVIFAFFNVFAQDKQSIKVPDQEGATYAPYQDSIYNRFMQMKVPARTLFNFNLALADATWEDMQNQHQTTPYQSALDALSRVPSSAYIPTGVEQTLYETNLQMAQYVPFQNQHLYGLKVPLNDIAQLLGLAEDVSPVIVYSLDGPLDVEIVIYSIQAKVIATLYSGRQAAGSYKITWNLRDDMGRRMPSGDYIAEVRIGNSKYVRKRIVIP